MMTAIDERRTASAQKLTQFRSLLPQAASRIEGRACIYATGSYGRREGSRFSDLDLVIVGWENDGRRCLGALDEICVKAELINAAAESGLPPFDAEGRYLTHFTIEDLKRALGGPDDDSTNAFTSRLLVLLEGKPILGHSLHEQLIGDLVAVYWRGFENHRDVFRPTFLINDILRLWRTFCVNYEARTTTEPKEKLLKRRVKHYKLKYSRALTCYSAILHLLDVYRRRGGVAPDEALRIVDASPTHRIEAILAEPGKPDGAESALRTILSLYGDFLAFTDRSADDLAALFDDREERRGRIERADRFDAALFDAVMRIGGGTSLHRICLI